MKGLLLTALGVGAVYLMRNKDARDRVFSQVQNFTNRAKQSMSSTPVPSTTSSFDSSSY